MNIENLQSPLTTITLYRAVICDSYKVWWLEQSKYTGKTEDLEKGELRDFLFCSL